MRRNSNGDTYEINEVRPLLCAADMQAVVSAIGLLVGHTVPLSMRTSAITKRKARTLIRFLLVLGLAAASTAVEAQTPLASTSGQPSDLAGKLAEIEKQVEQKRKELGVPGVALAIVKDNKVIFQKGFGLRDVERNLPVTADTIFPIASCTKAFTAMAAVISQDAGRLSLEDSPKKHLAYFRLQDPEADARITVRDLLHHSSGLIAGPSDLFLTGVLNRTEMIKVAGLAKPTARLREKFQYQNTMYSAAGEVVAKANGTTWEKFVEQRIFKPLGMKSSYTSTRQMTTVRDHATGYSIEDQVATKAVLRDLTDTAPSGAITSNVTDMSQWVRLMLGGGGLDGKRLVSEKGFSEIVKRHITVDGDEGYGLGWYLTDQYGHHFIYHTGGTDGFTSLVMLVPDQNLGVVVLTNVEGSPLVLMARNAVLDNMISGPQTTAVNTESAPQTAPARPEDTSSAAFTGSDITVDELMAKAITAAGGEANLRRHHSTTGSGTIDFENQGFTGKHAVYMQAPNLSATITTIMGLGRTIGSRRQYFDGARGGVESNSGQTERYSDQELESARISADYYELLNWKTLYKTVMIRGKSKVAGQDVYVVVKTPEKSDAVIDYISATSFLLVKRRTGEDGEETEYNDYRNVDGEMVPFGFVVQGGIMGRIVIRVQEVKFNTSIPPSIFRTGRTP